MLIRVTESHHHLSKTVEIAHSRDFETHTNQPINQQYANSFIPPSRLWWEVGEGKGEAEKGCWTNGTFILLFAFYPTIHHQCFYKAVNWSLYKHWLYKSHIRSIFTQHPVMVPLFHTHNARTQARTHTQCANTHIHAITCAQRHIQMRPCTQTHTHKLNNATERKTTLTVLFQTGCKSSTAI